MSSPYAGRPSRSFWKTGVVEVAGAVLPDLYRAKFAIDRGMPIATAGSCFAQHIGRAMRARGFKVLDAEPAPPGLDEATAASFGYGIYSARYANIYTVRQFVQLVSEALGRFTPAERVWEKDGRYFDAMRPSVEPQGLATAELVLEHRAYHLSAVLTVLREAEVLVFTMGLTEAWADRDTGCVYPTAPGTIAGTFDARRHVFRNQTYPEIAADFEVLRELLHEINPGLRMLVTVSPVPLTATASEDHVLVASTYSKSVLRAVAGDMAGRFDDVDYFPSYEVITGAKARGRFFGDNLRTVEPIGVATVMATFFGEAEAASEQRTPAADEAATQQRARQRGAASPERAGRRTARIARQARSAATPAAAQGDAATEERARRRARRQARRASGAVPASGEDVVCEEALLEAFAR